MQGRPRTSPGRANGFGRTGRRVGTPQPAREIGAGDRPPRFSKPGQRFLETNRSGRRVSLVRLVTVRRMLNTFVASRIRHPTTLDFRKFWEAMFLALACGQDVS